MKGTTLIHLSTVGSRSKQLASHDSDYDLKAIILHSTENYLLQNVTPNKAFVTSIVDPNTDNAVEVEGTLVDYLNMMDHALKSHQVAYAALFGIAIYETSESEHLKQLFHQAYDPRTLLVSYSGIMHSERLRAKKKHRQNGIKHAANIVYYASILHVFQTNPEPPLPGAFSLERLKNVDSKLRKQIKSLYEHRKLDKSISDFDLSQFRDFIKSANDLKARESTQTTGVELQTLRTEAHKNFLKLCLK
mmetsp:Transcript_27215/g.49120  ORF Transcript_27215/g.49120 Transcript_27215/m.49120 type:complete len:247 (-) Transcript_27215:436-1176(-)